MKVKLDYGRDGLEIEVPDSAAVLQMAPSERLDQIEERIDHALARPIGTPSLRRLAQGTQKRLHSNCRYYPPGPQRRHFAADAADS